MNASLRTIVLCSLLVLAACSLPGGDAKRLARAEAALAKGDYNAAVIDLRSVIDKDAANKAAQLLLLKAHLQRGDLDAAQAALDGAVKAGASAAELAEARARLLAGRGKLQDLLDSIEAGNSGFAEPQRTLYKAHALLGLGKVMDAMPLYDQLLAAHPDLIDARLRAAESHVQLGRPELALEQLDAALKTNPQSAEGWALRAGLLQAQGRLEQAREARMRALALAPGQLTYVQHITLISSAFMTALQAGDTATAAEVHKTLQSFSPQGPLTRLYGAELELAVGDPSKAAAELTKLIADVPDLAQARTALVSALVEKDNYELALRQIDDLPAPNGNDSRNQSLRKTIRDAADKPADSVEHVVAVASTHVLTGEAHLARRVLQQSLASHPQSIELAASSIGLDLKTNLRDKALERARQLAHDNPKSGVAVSMLAEALTALDKHAEAAEVLEQYWVLQPSAQGAVALSRARRDANLPDSTEPMRRWLQRKPGDSAVRLLLADAEATLGHTDMAITEYERVLKDHPDQPLALNNLAVLYGERNDPRGLALAKRIWEASPKAPLVIDTYAWLLVRAGRSAEAKPLFEQALALAPNVPEIRFHYAQALAATGDKAGARRWVDEALRGGGTFAGRDEALKLRESLVL